MNVKIKWTSFWLLLKKEVGGEGIVTPPELDAYKKILSLDSTFSCSEYSALSFQALT